MKAVVFHRIEDIRLEDVKEPTIKELNPGMFQITASAICATDLHMVRGTLTGLMPGTILGHEGVGIVEEIGELIEIAPQQNPERRTGSPAMLLPRL